MTRRLVVFVVTVLAFATAGLAVDVCSTAEHQGSVAYVYPETDIFVSFTKPGLGNNPGDCSSVAHSCEIYRCDTFEASEFTCKLAPGGACVEYEIETCYDSVTFIRKMPIVRTITLVHVGPCEL